MRASKLDHVLKRKIIHSVETRVEGLGDVLDVNVEVKEQLEIVKSLALTLNKKGLTIKQSVYLRATIRELRIKFEKLDEIVKEEYFKKYEILGLRELLSNN